MPVLVDTEYRSDLLVLPFFVTARYPAFTARENLLLRKPPLQRLQTNLLPSPARVNPARFSLIFLNISMSSTLGQPFFTFWKGVRLINRTGELLHSEIEGALIIKSFIKGHPRVCIGLSEDLRVGRANDGTSSDDQPSYRYCVLLAPCLAYVSSCVLDQATFHSCCNFAEWDMDKTIMFEPPEGEFSRSSLRSYF